MRSIFFSRVIYTPRCQNRIFSVIVLVTSLFKNCFVLLYGFKIRERTERFQYFDRIIIHGPFIQRYFKSSSALCHIFLTHSDCK
jgi:hypothetical protein